MYAKRHPEFLDFFFIAAAVLALLALSADGTRASGLPGFDGYKTARQVTEIAPMAA